jgi:hypothetical protein
MFSSRRSFLRLAASCLVTLGMAKPTLSIDTHGHFFGTHTTLHVTFHIPYREQNRLLNYHIESEHYESTSSIELDTTRQTFDRYLPNLPSGEYEIVAVLDATDGSTAVRDEFTIS